MGHGVNDGPSQQHVAAADADSRLQMDVTTAMQEMERRQEKGEVPEDEMEQLNKDLMGKLLLISWKGTRFESGAVLRQVVDNVLTREPGVSDSTLLWRAKGLIVIGAIFKAVEPDESDEERRELERCVSLGRVRCCR